MDTNNSNYISKCISCNGTGIVNCDCGTDNNPNKRCLTCAGEGRFMCPICEGEGIL
ncbi:hypothetical protein R0131_10535 [Clostridium sp. AL.422]|uniref:hypothetical protein n=1 Tax=Clostridium TaxID=1485 RepID=UPI00293DAF0C|nr:MULTISPECIES: hypothetical protein [unclassified Clostridium]MDV4151278.1 hypothetical protein [Clostridium sp. AL.422]